MRFQLLKPLHGWRAFLGEVGVIVLGVLLALAAQQVVDSFNWRSQVDEARRALALEISDSIGQGYDRQRTSECIDNRLDQISAILTKAAQTGRLPPVGNIGRPPSRTWVSNAWQTTMAGQTAAHFSRHELNQIGYIYDFVQRVSDVALREILAWSDLQSIAGPGRPVSPEEIGALLRSVELARTANTYVGVLSTRIIQVASQTDLPYDRKTIEESSADPNPRSLCEPISTDVPKVYGHSAFEGILKAVKQTKITIH